MLFHFISFSDYSYYYFFSSTTVFPVCRVCFLVRSYLFPCCFSFSCVAKTDSRLNSVYSTCTPRKHGTAVWREAPWKRMGLIASNGRKDRQVQVKTSRKKHKFCHRQKVQMWKRIGATIHNPLDYSWKRMGPVTIIPEEKNIRVTPSS